MQISAMRFAPAPTALLLAALAPALPAQHFHHLAATPTTVAYGYYSAAATPVLRIASGDTIEVETMITNRPDRLRGRRGCGRRCAAVAARHRHAGDRQGAGRSHSRGAGLRGGCRFGRRARSAHPAHRSRDSVRLQRLRRVSAGEL